MPVWSSSSRPPRARRQRSDKAGPAQAGPATFGEFSLSLNSIADPPASVGIANTVRPAAAAGSGCHHYSARRDHDSRSDVGSAHAIGIAMPSGPHPPATGVINHGWLCSSKASGIAGAAATPNMLMTATNPREINLVTRPSDGSSALPNHSIVIWNALQS